MDVKRTVEKRHKRVNNMKRQQDDETTRSSASGRSTRTVELVTTVTPVQPVTVTATTTYTPSTTAPVRTDLVLSPGASASGTSTVTVILQPTPGAPGQLATLTMVDGSIVGSLSNAIPTLPSDLLSSNTSPLTITSFVNPSAVSSTSGGGGGSGWSTGAIVGITLGGVAFCIALIAIIFAFCVALRKRDRAPAGGYAEYDGQEKEGLVDDGRTDGRTTVMGQNPNAMETDPSVYTPQESATELPPPRPPQSDATPRSSTGSRLSWWRRSRAG